MISKDQTENDKCIFTQAEISSGRLGGCEHGVLDSEGDAGADDCDHSKSDTLEMKL